MSTTSIDDQRVCPFCTDEMYVVGYAGFGGGRRPVWVCPTRCEDVVGNSGPSRSRTMEVK